MSYADLGRAVKIRYPKAYDDISDEDLGRAVSEKYPGAYDDITGHARAEELRAQARNIETRSTEDGFLPQSAAFARDLTTSAIDAGAGVLDAAGGVQGLIGGGWDNLLRRSAKNLQDFADKRVASPEMRKQRQEVDDVVEHAVDPNDPWYKRIGEGIGARAKGLATNPLAAADFAITQAGQLAIPMGVGQVAGRIGKATAAGLEAAAQAARAASFATRAAVFTGALVQGGSVGGGAYDDLVALPDEKWQALPEFKKRVEAGETPESAKESIASKYARVAGGAGALTSILFNMGDAAQTTERVLAGAAMEAAKAGEKGVMGRVAGAAKSIAVESLVSEPGEEATGQIAQNMALNEVDGETDLLKGVGDAIGGAAMGGAMMGGPTSIAENFQTEHAHAEAPRIRSAESGVDGSILEGSDPVSERNIAVKKQRIDAEFDAVLKEKPHLASLVDSWRKENPLEDVSVFEADAKAQEAAKAADDAVQHPAVQAAQAQAQEAQATLEAAQQVTSSDPSEAPPPGLTPDKARDVLENGTAKLEEQAHAAQENVRTQIQTVEKESTQDSVVDGVSEIADGAKQEVKKNAAMLLKELQAAMVSGAIPMDEQAFAHAAIASGMPEAAVDVRLATVRKQIEDRKAKEEASGGQGESGSPTPGGAPSSQVGGAAPAAQEGAAGGVGATGTAAPPSPVEHEAVTARGSKGKYTLKAVPLSSLVTSDQAGYPAEVQPRDRDRHHANETVRRIGRDLNPALLMPTPSVADGPAIVGPDSVVEGGNGRVMGMRAAAARGSEGWAQYQEMLRSRASEFGIDPSSLDGMKDPVLVRERAFDVPDRAEFARELNESFTNSMDASSQARADAARMYPALLGAIAPDSDSLRSEENGDFLNGFIQKVVPEGDRPALRDAQGAPSTSAVVRAHAALFAKVYGMDDSKAFREVLAASVEESDPDGMNMIQGMRLGAPSLAYLGAYQDLGKYDIGGPVVEAVALLVDLRRRGVSLREYVASLESDAFAHQIPEEVLLVAKTFSSMSRSARKIGATIRAYSRIAAATVNADIFNNPPTRIEAWTAAAQEVNHESQGQSIPPAPAEVETPRGDAPRGGEGAAEVPAGAQREDAPGSRPSPHQVAPAGHGPLFGRLLSMLSLDTLPRDNGHLRKIVTEEDGAEPSPARMKEAQETFEAALATWVRQTILEDRSRTDGGVGEDILYANLLDVYQRQPNLNIRTPGSLERQAYSTPAPLAFLAARMGGAMSTESTVFEPTAGTGLLTIGVPTRNVIANEIDPFRAGLLAAQGVKTFQGDARNVFLNGVVAERSVDSVMTNPPFGAILAPDGSKIEATFDGVKMTHIDHLIAANALRAMKDQGRACLILGAEKINGSKFSTPHWVFQNWLYKRYNVVGHFEVDGDLYQRQGAAWPVQVIVVNGRANTGMIAPDPKSIKRAMTWEEVHAASRQILDSEKFRRRFVPVADPSSNGGTGDGSRGGRQPVRSPVAGGNEEAPAGGSGAAGGGLQKPGRNGGNDVEVAEADSASGAGPTRPSSEVPVRSGPSGEQGGERGPGGTGSDAGGHQSLDDRGPSAVAYGSNNKIVTKDRADALAARLRAKLNPNRMASLPMLDPELVSIGSQLAAFHIEAGTRAFVDVARQIAQQLEMTFSQLSGMLPQWYSSAGDYLDAHGGDSAGMDARPAVMEALAGLLEEEAQARDAEAPVEAPEVLAPPIVSEEPTQSSKPRPEQVEHPTVQADTDSLQAEYSPVSYRGALDEGVRIPTTMAQAFSNALYDFRNEVGPLDEFVAQELGISVESLREKLMGTQVDGIALAIKHAKNGKAVIIADQTGVGKGRQAASMILWAIKNGRVPVFCTESAKLFTPMFADDIASLESGIEVKPFILNDDGQILTQDGSKVAVKTPSKNAMTKVLSNPDALESEGFNCVFCTYSQFQNGGRKPGFLKSIASRAHIILDEAHLAAGASKRGEVFQRAIEKAASATYLSATWAKRADNMVVFAATDIGDLKMTAEQLTNAMVRGGYALQTTISSQLTRAGQMARRERSWDGISFEKVTDKEHRGEHEVIWDSVTSRLLSIMQADDAFSVFFESYTPPANVRVSSAGNKASSVTHADFVSVVHNFIHQLSLGIKADVVADKAIEAIKNGEAPLIALESTMGSFLEEFAKDNKLNDGDDVGTFDWRTFLHRGLERTRRIKITDEGGQETFYIVGLDELDSDTYAAYQEAMDFINALEIDVPASPIDWIRHRINEAGFKVGEFTGRKKAIDYTIPGAPRLASQKDTKKDQVRIQREFNVGDIHCVILNVSGATGISLHADARWSDPNNPRPRVMFVAQAARDINVFMQILGRCNRTGQIAPPRYEMIALDLPSESRPFSVLMKKMSSLNANTSSRTDGHTSIESTDIINRYGDYIVAQYLSNNQGIAEAARISVPASVSEDSPPLDFAMKATGRMAVAPVHIQRQFWDGVTGEYNNYIDYLTETGKNRLIKRTLDLRAKEVSRVVLHPGTGGNSAFAVPAHLVTYNVRVSGNPMSAEEVKARVSERLNGKTPEAAWDEMFRDLDKRYRRFMLGAKESSQAAMAATREAIVNDPPPKIGESVSVKVDGQDLSGVVLDVSNDTSESNPMARSRFLLHVATNNPNFRTLRIPLTRFDATGERILFGVEEAMKYDGSATQARSIVVGNLFAAYKQLSDNVDTEIASFSLDDGSIVDGIILPRNFDQKADVKDEFSIPNVEMAKKVLPLLQGTSNRIMQTTDGDVLVAPGENGGLSLSLTSGAKDTILKWSRNLGVDFVKVGSRGASVDVPAAKVDDVMSALVGKGLNVSSKSLRELGILENGAVHPEAFDNPVNLFDNISLATVAQAARILGVENGSEHRNMVRSLDNLQKRRVALADLADYLNKTVAALEDGDIPLKGVNWVKEIEQKVGYGKKNVSGVDPSDARSAANLCRFLARAVVLRKIGEKQLPGFSMGWRDIEANREHLDKAFGWLDGEFNGQEFAKVISFSAWCFKEKNGFAPNMRTADGVKDFVSFINAERTLASSKMAGIAAVGLAVVGGGALAIGTIGALPTAMIGAGYLLTNRLGAFLWDSLATSIHSAKARIMRAGENGIAVVENLDQVFLRTTEILSKPAYLFNSMQRAASKVGLPMEEVGRLLADHVEKGTPLPEELKALGKDAKRIMVYFEDRMKAIGMKTLEEYFPRRYKFEGLRALKGDKEALKALAKHIEGQLLENDPDGVDKVARRLFMPLDRAASALAVQILENIYDDTEESKSKASKAKAERTHQWILEILGDKVDERAYARVRDIMRHNINPLAAQSTLSRKLKFQLPESWQLSNGTEVGLVDRNYFTVAPRYMESMSRSLAQKELLDKKLINGFLNDIGGVDNEQRATLETDIRNDLRGITRGNLSDDDFQNPIARKLFQNPREMARRYKVANSVLYLGLNVAYPTKNLLFGAPFAAGLTDLKTAAKAGAVLVKAMLPIARRASIHDAAVAGALSSHIYDDVLNEAHWFGRAVTAPMIYTQHAVDAAGFYAGRDYAPKVLRKAIQEASRGERGEFFGIMQSTLGRERALDVIASGELTENDLDRFGLVYRNKISGTARNLNLPRLIDNEFGKLAFQFSSIPMEQQKIYTDEIAPNGRRKAQFYTGAFAAGAILCAMRLAFLMGFKRDDDDDKVQKEIDWYLDGSMGGLLQKIAYSMQVSGGFLKASPIASEAIGSPSGWKPNEAEMLASLTGIQLLPRFFAGVRAWNQGAEAWSKAREEGFGIVDQATVAAMPLIRETLNGQTALFRSADVKVGKTDAEEDLEGR